MKRKPTLKRKQPLWNSRTRKLCSEGKTVDRDFWDAKRGLSICGKHGISVMDCSC